MSIETRQILAAEADRQQRSLTNYQARVLTEKAEALRKKGMKPKPQRKKDGRVGRKL